MIIDVLKEIIQRSLVGYILVIPLLILYFFILNKVGKRQKNTHILLSFVLCYYLIGVLTVTGIGKYLGFSPRFEWLDFKWMEGLLSEKTLNIILFIPLGLFLPISYKNYNNIKKIASTGFLISLSIEFYQMFGRGITSINDLITNTIGACIGYIIYRVFFMFIKDKYKETIYCLSIDSNLEILFYWMLCFIIMISIQPMIISYLFKLG